MAAFGDSSKPATRDSLSQRVSLAAHVIASNSWAAKHEVDHAIAKAMSGGFDHVGVGRFLVEQQVISRDQAQELEEILSHQDHFPGYRLAKKIGSGGMGTVFLAEHLESGRQVALKTMNARLEADQDFIGRFHREAKALLAVKHPSVAEIIDSGETNGHCWLAMEFINGPSLMHLLKEYKALPEAYALRICRQIAAGLGHVWSSAHLVHRDIKPENILVVRNRSGGGDLFPPDDVAKLIDFGLVKSDEKDDRLTQTGMTIGTPLYMSPEQVRGEKLDCRCDIYGLGATLYHLLTGQTPFTGTSPGSIMSAHLTEPVPDPGDRVPSLSKGTRQLVMMTMAKDADRRYTTCEALVQAIDEILKNMGTHSGGTLRLLRKPLILNKPAGKKQTPAGGETAIPIDGPVKPPTSAIRPATHKDVRTPQPTDRIGRPTDRIGRTTDIMNRGTERVRSPLPFPDPNAVKPPEPIAPTDRSEISKVFDEDPHATLHMGILPWIVLSCAVVGLVLWFILRGS